MRWAERAPLRGLPLDQREIAVTSAFFPVTDLTLRFEGTQDGQYRGVGKKTRVCVV
jgi:hypothetical protein